MSESQSEVGNKGNWQDDSYYQEELQLDLDEVNESVKYRNTGSYNFTCYLFQLATSVTELAQVLSPLIQRAQDLTEAVSEHLHLAVTLTEILKSQEAKSLSSQQAVPAAQAEEDSWIDTHKFIWSFPPLATTDRLVI